MAQDEREASKKVEDGLQHNPITSEERIAFMREVMPLVAEVF